LDAAFGIPLSKTDIKKYAKKAGSDDASVTGLPFEDGIKNLQVNGSAAGLGGLKQLKIKKK
jgi:hypothetical protein